MVQTHEQARECLVEDGEIRHFDEGLPAAQALKQRNHSISRKSWRVALLVSESLTPLEKFTEFFHVLPFRFARADVVAASLNILKQ